MPRPHFILLAFVFLAIAAACGAPKRAPDFQGTRDRSDRAHDELQRQQDNKEQPER